VPGAPNFYSWLHPINRHLKNVFKSKTKVLGGYAEYAVAVESQLSLKPKNLGMIEAGALPKVALTSYKALQWYANAGNWTKAAAGPVVLVLGGSGGTGTCGIQLAKAYGASKVITTTSADNFAYVKALGADQVLDFRTQDWWTVLAAHSVDIVYDTVGQSGTGSRAMEVLNCQSQYFGHYVSITGALAPSPAKGCTQAAFINSDTNLDDGSILASLAALAEADKLRMPSIDSVFGIADVEKGFARSKTHEAKGKISIVCNHTAAQ
jgi:NADPH:quinone reductase-like Zn-dependent oxidoreductase